MTNAVAIKQEFQFTPEQLQLTRDTVAKGATPDELQLFIYRAKSMGLDPLKPGQVHFVKYGNSAGSIIVGIEGFRSIAHRTGKLSGIRRGEMKDEKGKLIGAWAEVFRSDWSHPAREEVPLEEYQGTSPIWRKMPATMIKKVAECAALRMAFPNDLGGVYAPEEMDQAAHPETVKVEAIRSTARAFIEPDMDSVTNAEKFQGYRIPFGKFAKRSLEEVGAKSLADYIAYLERSSAKDQKPLAPVVAEFVERASQYIALTENTPIKDGEADAPF